VRTSGIGGGFPAGQPMVAGRQGVYLSDQVMKVLHDGGQARSQQNDHHDRHDNDHNLQGDTPEKNGQYRSDG
jgi:hypothetical protein